jgi:hypothetical protein
MVVFRIALIGALAVLAISSIDTGRRWPGSEPGGRPRAARSRRPALHDPEEGEFVHAISRGFHRHSFLERA